MFANGVSFSCYHSVGEGCSTPRPSIRHNSLIIRRKSDYDKLLVQVKRTPTPTRETHGTHRYQSELPAIPKRPPTKFSNEILNSRFNQIMQSAAEKLDQRRKVADDYFGLRDYPRLRRATLSQIGKVLTLNIK